MENPLYVSVMTYADYDDDFDTPDATSVAYFSNPNVDHPESGEPTGTAQADNALTIRNKKSQVSHYRDERADIGADNPLYWEEFGWDVDIYSAMIDGEEKAYAIVGAYRENTAYIFEKDTDGKWNQVAKLYVHSQHPSDFGYSVAIDGDYAIVGAPWGTSQVAYIYERNASGEWGEIVRQSNQVSILTSRLARQSSRWACPPIFKVGLLANLQGGLARQSARWACRLPTTLGDVFISLK
jgi:hypothetical protein